MQFQCYWGVFRDMFKKMSPNNATIVNDTKMGGGLRPPPLWVPVLYILPFEFTIRITLQLYLNCLSCPPWPGMTIFDHFGIILGSIFQSMPKYNVLWVRKHDFETENVIFEPENVTLRPENAILNQKTWFRGRKNMFLCLFWQMRFFSGGLGLQTSRKTWHEAC